MGTTLGAAMVFLLKDNIASQVRKIIVRFCIGGDDRSIGVVFVDPIDRYAKGREMVWHGCRLW